MDWFAWTMVVFIVIIVAAVVRTVALSVVALHMAKIKLGHGRDRGGNGW